MKNRRPGRGFSATRRLVLCAVFAALAYVLMIVFRFRVQFLTFDLKDAVITVAGLLIGPMAALSISVFVAILEFITASDTGIYGLIMNMASSVTFSVVTAVVYRYRKRLSGAVIGLSGAVVALVTVMLALNLLVTPIYMTEVRGIPMATADVAKLIPTLLLPFNAIKALTNAALVLILYKPVSRAIRASGFLPHGAKKAIPATGTAMQDQDAADPSSAPAKKGLWVSLAVTAAGLLLLIAAILVFFLVLKGQVTLF